MSSNQEAIPQKTDKSSGILSIEEISEIKELMESSRDEDEKEAHRIEFIRAFIARIDDAIEKTRKEELNREMFMEILTQAKEGLEALLLSPIIAEKTIAEKPEIIH